MASKNTTISSICVSSIGSPVTAGRRMPYSVCSSTFESPDAVVSAAISQSISVFADE